MFTYVNVCAGWMYDITSSYDLPFYLAGVFIALSGGLLTVLPIINKIQAYRKQSHEKCKLQIPSGNHV